MVVSYGARDEDDEYDSEDEGQRGLFGMLQQNKRSSQGQIGGAGGGGGGGLGSMIEKFGASMTFNKDGNDSDEDSVVVKTFKKMGKKMKKLGKKRDKNNDDSSSEEEESSDEEDSDDDDEDETSDDESSLDDDRSISKRVGKAGKAAIKMTGKLTKGFLGRGRDDSNSEELEEDPLFAMDNNNNNKKNNLGMFFSKKKTDGEDTNATGRRRRASNIEHTTTPTFRRTQTDGAPAGRKPGRSKSTDQAYYNDMVKKNLSKSVTHQRSASPHRERHFAQTEPGLNRAAARAKAQEEFMEPAEAVWSMNVTEKMLEEAAKKGEFVHPSAAAGGRRRPKC